MSSDELTDQEMEGYMAKHKRIRGSYELKYPPRAFRCERKCGRLHCEVEGQRGIILTEHPCFLAIGHRGECQFSSECARLTGRRAA